MHRMSPPHHPPINPLPDPPTTGPPTTGRNRRSRPALHKGRVGVRMGAAATCASAIALLSGGAAAAASIPAASPAAALATGPLPAVATPGGAAVALGHTAGCRARTIPTAIEGAQASPVVPRPPGPVSGLNGFTVHSDAATASGQNGTSGANTGGLLPVGTPHWSPSMRGSHQATGPENC